MIDVRNVEVVGSSPITSTDVVVLTTLSLVSGHATCPVGGPIGRIGYVDSRRASVGPGAPAAHPYAPICISSSSFIAMFFRAFGVA
jgi:hypothetical protein